MEYNPRPNIRYYRVRYLLNKLKENENIPVNLYNHFHTTLSENNKAYHIIPIENKCWSHIAPFSRLYLVKQKVVAQLKSQQ